MAALRRSAVYDRSRLLEQARRAQARRRRRRAIALYRRVLLAEPGNPELHGKLAPLLAQTGQAFDAWLSFQAAAKTLLQQNQLEPALAIYRQAAQHLPRQVEAWIAVAALERRRGRDRDALAALRRALRHFRRRGLRPQAIHLLRRAREIEPWDPDVVLDLARLLGRSGQRHEQLHLLAELARRCAGRALRRARGAQLRAAPTPAHLLAWLHALVAAREPKPARLPERGGLRRPRSLGSRG